MRILQEKIAQEQHRTQVPIAMRQCPHPSPSFKHRVKTVYTILKESWLGIGNVRNEYSIFPGQSECSNYHILRPKTPALMDRLALSHVLQTGKLGRDLEGANDLSALPWNVPSRPSLSEFDRKVDRNCRRAGRSSKRGRWWSWIKQTTERKPAFQVDSVYLIVVASCFNGSHWTRFKRFLQRFLRTLIVRSIVPW